MTEKKHLDQMQILTGRHYSNDARQLLKRMSHPKVTEEEPVLVRQYPPFGY